MGPEPLAWFRLAYPKTPTAASSTGHYGGLAVSECEGLALRGVCSCKANPVHGVFAAKWQMDGTAGPLVAELHAPLHTKMGK